MALFVFTRVINFIAQTGRRLYTHMDPNIGSRTAKDTVGKNMKLSKPSKIAIVGDSLLWASVAGVYTGTFVEFSTGYIYGIAALFTIAGLLICSVLLISRDSTVTLQESIEYKPENRGSYLYVTFSTVAEVLMLYFLIGFVFPAVIIIVTSLVKEIILGSTSKA